MSPLDFSVEELDQLLDLASDIEKHPKARAFLIRFELFPVMQISVQCGIQKKARHSLHPRSPVSL